jgi:lysophospholipase L1-like esterase
MRILCFGDSNTYGYDPRDFWESRNEAENRWTDLLEKHTGCQVINAGSNGRTIPPNPDLLISHSQYAQSDWIFLMLGTNDLLQGTTAEDTAAKMAQFLKGLLPCRSRILLIAPPPFRRGAWIPSEELIAESIQLAEKYSLLAHHLGIPFLDTRNWNIELAFDGVHFSEAGHRTFARNLHKELCQNHRWQNGLYE